LNSNSYEVEKRNGFFKGAFALTLSSLLVKILGVIYKIPLSHILDDEGMGFFNSAYTVYTFFFLLCSAGVPKAITILVNDIRAKSDKSEERALVNTAIKFFFVVGIFISILFLCLSGPLSKVISNSKSVYSMLAIAPSIAFISLSSVLRGYLNGVLRFWSVAISQFIEAFFKLAFGLILANTAKRMNLPCELISAYAIFGITLGSLLTCAHLYIEVNVLKRKEKTGQSVSIAKKHIKNICKISLPITASAAITSMVNIIDLTIIMRRLNDLGYGEHISGILYGNYTTLAVPMFNFALSLITSICMSALPLLTELQRKGKQDGFSKCLQNASTLSAFVSAPATVLFLFYSKESLQLLFDEASVALGGVLLSLLAPSVLLISLLTLINTTLEASGSYNAPLISMGIGAAVKLFSSYLLVGNANFAIWGAPLGTMLSYLVSILVSSVLFYKSKGFFMPIIKHFLLPVINAAVTFYILEKVKGTFKNFNTSTVSSIMFLFFFVVIYVILCGLTGVISKKKIKNM